MKLRGYIFSRTFLQERVPQHIQNIIIRDYCIKYKFTYLLSATEYAMPSSNLMLNLIVSEFDYIDGIVAYSIFQLPENFYSRSKINYKGHNCLLDVIIVNNTQKCKIFLMLKFSRILDFVRMLLP